MKLPLIDSEAPPERLAAFRITASVFTLGYLLLRFRVFTQLAGRDPDGFLGVGVFARIDGPVTGWVVHATLALAVGSGIAAAMGWRYRLSGPAFAFAVLVLTSYRSSWGQQLHFENLFTMHLIVLAFSPAADAWSIDARRRQRSSAPGSTGGPTSVAYGWPLRLACSIVVVTYAIAGVAKLRYGGWEWIAGDTLRNHIAYSAARLELLGATPTPLAAVVVRSPGLLPAMAAASVTVELAAPLALLGGRLRNAWVIAAWLMHLGILALMLVGFPYPLFLAAFAPFFPLEQWVGRAQGRLNARW